MFIDTGKCLINTDNISMIKVDKGNMVINFVKGKIISYTIVKENMKPDIYAKIIEALKRGDKYLYLGIDNIENLEKEERRGK